jgi:hypothetical protein
MSNKCSEVIFRASTDNSATIKDKIYLSNITIPDSFNPEIAATNGDKVIVK